MDRTAAHSNAATSIAPGASLNSVGSVILQIGPSAVHLSRSENLRSVTSPVLSSLQVVHEADVHLALSCGSACWAMPVVFVDVSVRQSLAQIGRRAFLVSVELPC